MLPALQGELAQSPAASHRLRWLRGE
jgi:hypothetical protein